MKSKKAQRILEQKKQSLESRIAAAQKVLAETPSEIRTEVGRILSKLLGVDVHNFADFVSGKFEFDSGRVSLLTSLERELFGAWWKLTYDLATDRYELQQTESLLNPRKGRSNKAIDRCQRAAIDEWTSSSGLTLQQLAIKHSGLKDRKEQKKWADNLRKRIERSDVSVPSKRK